MLSPQFPINRKILWHRHLLVVRCEKLKITETKAILVSELSVTLQKFYNAALRLLVVGFIISKIYKTAVKSFAMELTIQKYRSGGIRCYYLYFPLLTKNFTIHHSFVQDPFLNVLQFLFSDE